MNSMDKITFDLNVDKEIRLRNIHPDDTEALFVLIERNRARLRPWVDPDSLSKTAKTTRLFTIQCLYNFMVIPLDPANSINTFMSWSLISHLPTVRLIWEYGFMMNWLASL